MIVWGVELDNGPDGSNNGTKVLCRLGDGLQGQGLIDGKQGEFQASGNPQLVEDIAEMVFDRVLADLEVFCDLLVGVSGDHGGNDLQLPRGKSKFLFAGVFAGG